MTEAQYQQRYLENLKQAKTRWNLLPYTQTLASAISHLCLVCPWCVITCDQYPVYINGMKGVKWCEYVHARNILTSIWVSAKTMKKQPAWCSIAKNLRITVRLIAIQMPLFRNVFAPTPFNHIQCLQLLKICFFFLVVGIFRSCPPCTWCCHESQPAMQEQVKCRLPQTPNLIAKQKVRRLWVEEATENTGTVKTCICRNVCYNYLALRQLLPAMKHCSVGCAVKGL